MNRWIQFFASASISTLCTWGYSMTYTESTFDARLGFWLVLTALYYAIIETFRPDNDLMR